MELGNLSIQFQGDILAKGLFFNNKRKEERHCRNKFTKSFPKPDKYNHIYQMFRVADVCFCFFVLM